jgi:hypothetical protein
LLSQTLCSCFGLGLGFFRHPSIGAFVQDRFSLYDSVFGSWQ